MCSSLLTVCQLHVSSVNASARPGKHTSSGFLLFWHLLAKVCIWQNAGHAASLQGDFSFWSCLCQAPFIDLVSNMGCQGLGNPFNETVVACIWGSVCIMLAFANFSRQSAVSCCKSKCLMSEMFTHAILGAHTACPYRLKWVWIKQQRSLLSVQHA